MMQSKIKTISEVGEVLFERSSRAKRVNISVRPFKPVRVAVPKGVAFGQAEHFLESQLEWVKYQQRKARHYEQSHRDTMANRPVIDRETARAFLTKRLGELARQHGFQYGKVTIRNQKTRWGSCSSQNNISLNMNLMRLPADLIDYVLLHELVHTKVKDHSVKFWAEVDKLVGDSRGYRHRLRKYRLEVV